LAFFIVKYQSDGSVAWAKAFGDNNSTLHAKGVAIDGANNIIVVGDFGGTADFGGVSKTSTPSAGGTYIPDIFVAKYNPDGTLMWVQSFGGSSLDTGNTVAVDGSGNIFLGAEIESASVNFGGTTLSSANGMDVMVLVKILPGSQGTPGTVQWAKQWGNATVYSVAVDKFGDLVVAGFFSGTADFGGSPKTSAGAYDMFLVKYSGVDGSYKWDKTFGSSGNDYGYGVATDPNNGNVILTGTAGGQIDFGKGPLASGGIFLAAFDSSGNTLWALTPNFSGFSGNDKGYAVSVDASGNIFWMGQMVSTLYFGGPTTLLAAHNCFVASHTSAGTYRWAKGDSGASSYPGGVALDSLGHVLAGGSFVGTLRLDQTDPNSPTLTTPVGTQTAPFLIQYSK
jgi:hypothetical protein